MSEKKQMREYGTGCISQRKDGKWTARITVGTNENGKPKVKAFYGNTEREVKKKLKDFQKELAKNDYVVVQRNTVAVYMTNWLESNKRNELKPKSYDRLEQTLAYQVFPKIGHLQIASIQSSHVQKMVNDLRDEGYSYSTIKKAYDAVNDCFRTGMIQKTVMFNPALGVKLPSKKSFGKTEIKFYEENEIKQIQEAAVETFSNGKQIYRLGAAIPLAINTGLRMAELLGLKWNDISFEKKTLSVNGTRVVVKNRSVNAESKYIVIDQDSAKTEAGERTIPLNDDAYNALLNLKGVTGDFEYVLSTENGNPILPRYLDRLCRCILVKAGLPEEKIYGLHSLRHTFASMLFRNGVDVKTVSELLGHSDVTITYNTYIHLIEDQKRIAVETMNKKPNCNITIIKPYMGAVETLRCNA